MPDPIILAVSQAHAALARASRAMRCLELAELARLYGNAGADDLRDAALEELRTARASFHIARSHAAIAIATSVSLPRRLVRRLRREARRDLDLAIASLGSSDAT